MRELIVWMARLMAALNVALALLMLWGASIGIGTRRASIAQHLGLLLLGGSIAAAAAAFRYGGQLRAGALLMMGALPLLAVVCLRLAPAGDTPVRDAILVSGAFALPPLLLALARAGDSEASSFELPVFSWSRFLEPVGDDAILAKAGALVNGSAIVVAVPVRRFRPSPERFAALWRETVR